MSDLHFKFKGNGSMQQPATANWQRLNRKLLEELDKPEHYFTEDEGLVAAVNTALTLGMPLLLTGEPGVGKTQLGYRIAYELGCNVIRFSVKSTTEAQDLFYQLDHLRRLHAVQSKQANDEDSVDIRHFLTFTGLGLAILRAMPAQTLQNRKLWFHAWPETEKHLPGYGVQQPSVLIIDEIEKAPQDFCNDILEEIRLLKFNIPELGFQPFSIYADPDKPDDKEKKFRPQLILTSNSAKELPTAFLRRCIFYQIPAPDKDKLDGIIDRRLTQHDGLAINLDEDLRNQALDLFLFLKTERCRKFSE